MKKLPYDKTLVLELNVQLADLMSRSVMLKSSVAAPIPVTDPFNSGDLVVTHTAPLIIAGAKSCLILSSFEDFNIALGPVGEVKMKCRGLFVNNGETVLVLVTPPQDVDAVRMRFIWA